MEENNENKVFEISPELIDQIKQLIEVNDIEALLDLFEDFHYADVAEILEELNFEEGIYIIKLLDSEKTSDVLAELDEDLREKILNNLSAKEIAEEVAELDTASEFPSKC